MLTGLVYRRDAFQRRERASEDWAIRQREKEKLLELKKKLAEQQEHLTRLSEHMCVTLTLSIMDCSLRGTLADHLLLRVQ